MNKREYDEGHKRKDVLNMQPGQRTLRIETKIAVAKMLHGKIHIAAIQETHIPHD